MLLRLMDASDITALLGVEPSVNVLLQDLEISRHRVERCAELVTETRKKLRLDTIGCLGILSRDLLALESELQLARALSDARIQGAVEGLHAFFGLTARAHIAKEPAERT